MNENNKKLNISVIGELISGKSTFINALLGKELLPTGILPAIAVPTAIEYDRKYHLIIRRCDAAQEESFSFSVYENMKRELDKLTTLPEEQERAVTRTLKYVRVCLPADILEKNIRIIDTPPFERMEEWEVRNDDATIRTLVHISDLFIVLIPAHMALTMYLKNFLKSRLSGVLSKCVFVLSRWDQIRSEEKEAILQYCKSYLEKELGLENPVVLPYVPTRALLAWGNEIDKTLLEEAWETEKKLLRLIQAAYSAWEEDMNKNEANYFSLENLRSLSGIDEHLGYAERLIATFGRETEQYGQLCAMLEQIKEKQNDKKLNISVIGEFTSGKSTFINALLGKELLVSSMMQGTTVASTIIEYSQHYELIIKRCDTVQAETLRFNDFHNLKKVLEKLTTDPTTARALEFVHVFMPADILKKNIRIIDTPGTNVTEAWHEDVTIRTLNQMSDLSIILISAQKPAPETLLNFLSSQLSGILPQCVFVVSMLDLIRPKERRSMMQFIKAKLGDELELENAIVLPYVSTFVLGDEETGKVDAELLEESLETEKKLLQHTARQRTVAQTKKLLHLIQTIYIALEGQMKGITQKYEDRLAELERTRQTDLESFIKQQTDVCKQDFDDKIAVHVERLEKNLSGMSLNAKNRILRKLDDLNNIDNMKNYLTGAGVKNDCTAETGNFTEKAMEIMNPAETLFESEMYYFEKQFKKLYQKLKILEVNVKLDRQKPDCSIAGISADFSSTASYISAELSKENWSLWGGAAAGAAVGTAILPGFGTVIGGMIGMFVGAPSNEKTDAVRQNCKEKLNVPLTNYFDAVESQTIRSVEKYLSNMKKTLERQFQRYLKAYLDEVNHQISIEENEQAGVMEKINTLKQEMHCLENHRQQLESFYGQMDKLGRNADAAHE